MKKVVLAGAMLSLTVTGCATKRYGRLQPLTGAERVAYSCRDIDIEIAKVEAFDLQIKDGAQFNAASALGILGDFGIGNSMERGAAEKSAAQRLAQLHDLKAEKGCSTSTLTIAEHSAATASVTNNSIASISTDPADVPGTINTGRVKLVPSNSLSGYCIKAEAGYVGTGTATSPVVTAAKPLCT